MKEIIFGFLDILTEKILPVTFLAILGISGIVLICGFSFIRRIPGRRITGWLSIGAIVLVISFPYVSESEWRFGEFLVSLPEFIIYAIAVLSLFFNFVAPILTLAVTMILLFRAFTYVARTIQPMLSWFLTFLFSFGSGILFVILFWFCWRAEGGEGHMLPAAIGWLAMFVVISISLCVNIMEKTKRDGESPWIKKIGKNRVSTH
jgi:hypothetical protein